MMAAMDSPNIIRVPIAPGLSRMQQITVKARAAWDAALAQSKANLAAAMKEAGYSQAAIDLVLTAHVAQEREAWLAFHRQVMTEAMVMEVDHG